MSLGEPVDRAGRQRRGRRVPALPIGVAANPERARQVDDPAAALDQHRRELGGRCLGQRQKHNVGTGGEPLDVQRLDRAFPDPRQGRKRPGGAGGAGGHRRDERHRGMAGEDPHELLAGITGRAGNRHPGARAGGGGGAGRERGG